MDKTSGKDADADVRVVRDDELDSVVGGALNATFHFASFPTTGFVVMARFLPLPPNPC